MRQSTCVAALEIDPTLRAAYPLLGRAYRQSGDLLSAVSVLKKALDADPAIRNPAMRSGRHCWRWDGSMKARAGIGQVRNDSPTGRPARRPTTRPLWRVLPKARLLKRRSLLREAVRLAPMYGPALHSLGTLLLDRGSPDKAVAFLERAVQANPLNAATLVQSCAALISRLGKLTEALTAAKHAVVLNEDEAPYQRLVAEIQKRLKK